ncbi:MAG: Ni/Fe-hydrogenase, b-type cytochrome subunit [Bacillota bacterium]
MQKRVLVWEAPVRLFHWVAVISMFSLAVTGYYIGFPFLTASGEASSSYLMGWMRAVHFVAAFVLGIACLIRLYWFFTGNEYARFRDWIPVGGVRRSLFWRQVKYYLFLTRKRPEVLGHNPVAGLSYLIVLLLILGQGLIGFALYAEAYQDGFWRSAFGWLLPLFGNQNLRLTHHLLMWVFAAFLIVHLYMSVLAEIEERNGTLTSMFGGYKTEEQPDAYRDLAYREAAAVGEKPED